MYTKASLNTSCIYSFSYKAQAKLKQSRVQSKVVESLMKRTLVTYQPMELSATGKTLLPLFPGVLGVPVLELEETVPN